MFFVGEEVASIIILHSTWKSRMHQALFGLCWCLLICSPAEWIKIVVFQLPTHSPAEQLVEMILEDDHVKYVNKFYKITCCFVMVALRIEERVHLQDWGHLTSRVPISYNLLSDLVQQNQGYQGQAMIQARSVENSIGRRGVACSWGLAIAASGIHSVHLLQKARVQRWEGAWQQGCEYVILHILYIYIIMHIYIHTYIPFHYITLHCIALPYTTLHYI